MQKVHSFGIPLSRPSISSLEKERVAAVLDRGRLALGPETSAFEAAMAACCGTSDAVAVSSGTAALHLIVRALGLAPGDEVITTPYSFVASANVLLYEGLKPVFVDIRPEAYDIDVERATEAISPRTRAILAVDVFGVPADWPALEALARERGLLLIDDACEALGAAVDGTALGNWGNAAAFGFYPNKQITTGEGGCIATNDTTLAAACRSMRNHGRDDDGVMRHVRLGYNYRMDELSAAVGVAQLQRWDELNAARVTAAATYCELITASGAQVRLPARHADPDRSWFVFVVELWEQFNREDRDSIIRTMAGHGVECAPYFPTIHLQPYYRERFGFHEGDFPVSERVADRTLALPFFAGITHDEIERVAGLLAAMTAR